MNGKQSLHGHAHTAVNFGEKDVIQNKVDSAMIPIMCSPEQVNMATLIVRLFSGTPIRSFSKSFIFILWVLDYKARRKYIGAVILGVTVSTNGTSQPIRNSNRIHGGQFVGV
jgi:hypothetical protein